MSEREAWEVALEKYADSYRVDEERAFKAGYTAALAASAAPSVGEWIPVGEQTPKGIPLIGLDQFYGRIGECFRDGERRRDDGIPSVVFVDSDDCSITHYQLMPAAPPLPDTGER